MIRFFALALWLCVGFLASTFASSAQQIPLQGPGLGNLTYTDAELFRRVSSISWNINGNTNGMPEVHPPANLNPVRAYGINVGIMLNGYLVTAFAPDGGAPVGGFLIYDVSNPRSIVLRKTIYDPQGTTREFREPHSFGTATVNGRTYLVMQTSVGVEFWDFTDVNNVTRVRKVALPGVNGGDYEDVAWQLFWQAPYLYVASASRGIFIVDATDPANAALANRGNGRPNPIPIGSTGGFRIGPIFAMGNQMFVSSMETTAGFATLNLADPLNPVVTAVKSSIPLYYATCYNGKKVYTSGRDVNGVAAGYDVTDPRTIVTENESRTVEEGLYCATQDNNMFIGAQRHIFKYDITNPANYVELGRSERVANPTNPPPLAKPDPDLGQVTPFGNLIFVGGDHGHDTGFRPHQKAPDTTRPTVVAMSPSNGSLAQPVTSRIGFSLSDNILLETVNSTNFIVRVKNGAQVAGVYSGQLGFINFAPSAPLQINTEYEVVLKANGLKDYAGNGFAADATFTFKTGNPASGPATPTHRWPLSSSLTDVVAGNNGTASGADVYAQGGLDFTNRTTGVSLASNTIADELGASSTVTFRIKTTQVGSNSPWLAPGIFGRDQADGSNDIFWGWIDASGYINLSVGNSSASNPITRSSVPVNNGQWHEIAMTRNADTGAQAVYIDGVKTSSNATAGVMGLGNKFQLLGQVQGNPVTFKGILSDVRVFPRVLNDTEVANVFKPATPLTHRWLLQSTLTDQIGGNNGTASSADVYADNGLDFRNRTTGVQLASNTIADELGASATVSFKIKTTQVGSNQPWLAPGIFGRDQDAGVSDIFWGWIDASGFLNLSVGDASTSNPGTKSSVRVNDGLWHEIVMTRDADSGAQAVFIDGAKTSSLSTAGVMGLTAKLQMLGQIQGNPVAFKGILADVRVFSRVLTDTEARNIYKPESGIAHRWPLAASLTDVVAANDGTVTGADVYNDGGLDFTNRTTGVQLKSDTIATELASTATVTFRIKTTQAGNNSPWLAPGVFGRDQAGGGDDVFWGWIDGAGHLNLSVNNSGSANPGTRSTTPINNGQWRNVALMRDSDTGVQTMYVDGVRTTSNSLSGVFGLTNKFQLLGQIQGNPVTLKGILSDVRVYSRVLTQAEVTRVFQPDTAVLAQRQTGQSVTLDPAQLGLSGTKYIWNLGDGSPLITTTAASPVATYTYPNPGNYTISVTVISADGTETPYSFIQSIINPVTASAAVHTSNIVGNASFVYAVNPDDGTVAAINKSTLAKAWEVQVGKEPKTLTLDPSGRIWVAVQGDDKLVRIDPANQSQTSFPLAYGSAPYGVIFTPDGQLGLVTLAGKSTLARFDPVNGTLGTSVVLPAGGDARGIAISGDSTTAYVTRFRSKMTQAEIYKVNLGTMTNPTTIALPVDTTTIANEAAAPGVANYVNQVIISPDGRRAILPSKKDNIVNGRFRNGRDLTFDTTVRSVVSQVNLTTGVNAPTEQIDSNNRGPARSAIFAPTGNYIFVAQMESNSVEILDPYRRAVIGAVTGIGRTPHGLHLDATAKRLYVNNFLDRNVSVHDISRVLTGVDFITAPPTRITTVASEPLAANILAGKRIFYNSADTRMSNEQYISCASCHVDGDSDGMVWDFTQRGEGLRRTISLQGRQGKGSPSGKLHWTANFDELQDFEHDIRSAFAGTGFMTNADFQATNNPLGTVKAGRSVDLDNMAAYITSLNTFAKSPYRDASGCLTTAAQQGRTTFNNAGCTSCHTNAVVQDNVRHDVGTIQPSSGTGISVPLAGVGFDTPTLHGLWQQGSSYYHNGQANTFNDVFAASAQSGGANFSQQHGGSVPAAQVGALVTYLQSLDGSASCGITQ